MKNSYVSRTVIYTSRISFPGAIAKVLMMVLSCVEGGSVVT